MWTGRLITRMGADLGGYLEIVNAVKLHHQCVRCWCKREIPLFGRSQSNVAVCVRIKSSIGDL